MEERRQQPRKKLTTRLLWHVVLVSALLLFVTIATTFWHAYPAAKQAVTERLQQDVAVKLETNQFQLKAVEQQGELLAREFLSRYLTFRNEPSLQESFNAWFEETSPGVWRLKESFFTGTTRGEQQFKGLSMFIGPRPQPLNNELRARSVISVRTLNDLGPAWQNLVTNTHISLPENALAMYSVEQAWGRLAAADLVMTDFATLKSTLQDENPEREPNWTGLYKDHSAGIWTITYQRPVDHAGQHLINASFDVSLAQLTEDLSRRADDDIENYVLNAEGALVASSTLSAVLQEKRHNLTRDNYDDPLYQKIAARLLQAESSIHQEVWDDIDDDHLVLVQHLGTPNWWYFSVYPKHLITREALTLPLQIAAIGSVLVLGVLLTTIFFVRFQVSLPLRQLASYAALMSEKNYDAIQQKSAREVRGYGEVASVLNAFRIMAKRFVKSNLELEKRVHERTQELREANRKLDELVHIDGLTGALNRRAFQAAVEQALQQDNTNFFFVMADIDDFKPYNDNYGHEAGDRALVAFSKVFQSVPGARTYRYGGEEFALLVEADSLKQARAKLEEVRDAIHDLAIEHSYGRRLHGRLTVSFGLTQVRHGEDPSDLIKRADKNMYQAKRDGGDAIVTDTEMN